MSSDHPHSMGRCSAAAHRRFSARVTTLVAAVAAAVATATAGCGTAGSEQAVDPSSGLGPSERAVVVATSACGDAGPSSGSGVALSPGRVLTAAHVVAGSSSVMVSGGESTAEPQRAEVLAFDSRRDLALLSVGRPPTTAVVEPPVLATIAEDEQGTIVGGTASGDVPFTVVDATTIEMDEVRGTRRVRRSGYLLEARTLPGDSGAGLYDDAGHLVGLLFAVSTEDGTRSWATAAVEIEAFLADDGVTGRFRCDPEQSELRAIAD